jgi:hypothetical protein
VIKINFDVLKITQPSKPSKITCNWHRNTFNTKPGKQTATTTTQPLLVVLVEDV